MKRTLQLFFITIITICNLACAQNPNNGMISQTKLTNEKVQNHSFLECMYTDSYFPKKLVDKCRDILVGLSHKIEKEKPDSLKGLYMLTHASTIEINNLQEEFYANGSEIETAARECIAMDFEFISNSYGFEPDLEELIATRDW